MKLLTFIVLILIAPILAGVFGAILDQGTYTISPEFFRANRFDNIPFSWTVNERLMAGIAGWNQSWKFGVVLGIALSAIGTIHNGHMKMFYYTLLSFLLALGVTAVVSLIGMVVTLNTEFEIPVNMSSNIEQPAKYMAVIMINNYARSGGIIGVLLGVGYQLLQTKKDGLDDEDEEKEEA